MSEIGRKMFVGAGIGAGVGAVAGGIYGGISANAKIENLPTETVTLSGHQRPLYEERAVGRNTSTRIDFTGDAPLGNGHSSYTVTAKYPMRNADGSLQMEQIPARQVTGHGRPVTTELQHEIREPSGVRTNTHVGDNYGDGVNADTYTTVDYRTVGYWKEPVVRFETGVSTFGHIAGYAALGLTAGAIGGGLIAVALDKSGVA